MNTEIGQLYLNKRGRVFSIPYKIDKKNNEVIGIDIWINEDNNIEYSEKFSYTLKVYKRNYEKVY